MIERVRDRVKLSIVRLGHDGDGIAETPQGRVFVPFTLPGESIEAEVEGARGRLVATILPSPDRQTPACVHFGTCGGCALQHLRPAPYIAFKRALVVEAFKSRGLAPDVAEVMPIAPGTRRRVVLSAVRSPDGASLGFHAARGEAVIAVQECPVARPEIVRALPALRGLAEPLLSRRGALRMTVTAAGNGLDVAVSGAKPGADGAARLRAFEAARRGRFLQVTLDGELLVSLGTPMIDVDGIKVDLPPNAFLQAAVEAETELRGVVLAATIGAKRVADLFAGLGTFSLPLARRAQVTAVEVDRAALGALSAARRRTPGLKPITTIARDLFREPLSAKELDGFNAVVLDPPRQGAKAQAEMLAKSKVPLVVAVSCNPATLARDARILVDGGYALGAVTPVDQFLWSPHVELVAVLRRG